MRRTAWLFWLNPVTVAALAAAFATIPAHASDYLHFCRSASGDYEMNDGSLSRSGDSADVAYRTVKETLLSRETGYCQAKSGERYDYEYKSYTLRVSFTDHGQVIEIDMICELAADGTPAAVECSKTVVTSRTGTRDNGAFSAGSAAPSPGRQVWMHNGSKMKLIADGPSRRFVYDVPRAGMIAQGAKPGDTVFEGERNGDQYAGTAYIFKAGCGPQGYAVSGVVSGDQRSVTLEGQKPKLSKSCQVEGTKPDTLVFELLGE